MDSIALASLAEIPVWTLAICASVGMGVPALVAAAKLRAFRKSS